MIEKYTALAPYDKIAEERLIKYTKVVNSYNQAIGEMARAQVILLFDWHAWEESQKLSAIQREEQALQRAEQAERKLSILMLIGVGIHLFRSLIGHAEDLSQAQRLCCL